MQIARVECGSGDITAVSSCRFTVGMGNIDSIAVALPLECGDGFTAHRWDEVMGTKCARTGRECERSGQKIR